MRLHVIVLALLAAIVSLAEAAVPTTVTFTARLVDDASGEALTGSHQSVFTLYDAPTGGNVMWSESHEITPDDGMIYIDLGSQQALNDTVFSGKQLFLQVSLDGTLLEPRISLSSVPYAMRSQSSDKAADADKLGGVSIDALQKRVTGSCNTGQYLKGINADGTVACADDSAGTGDITEVAAGSGLVGGAMAGAATLALMSCTANQVLKSTGSGWMCAADNDTGDITGVTAGPGLVGGGASGAVTLSLPTSCSAGQLLKWNGSTWGCAADTDTDTNSGGTITGVSVGAAGGLMGGGTTGNVSLSLPNNCSSGQLLKYNGSVWACSNDIDTSSGGTITGVAAGAGLTGGGSTGNVTVNVGQGVGVVVQADTIGLDTAYTDARYLQQSIADARYLMLSGGSMTGPINMGGQTITNRGCPAGYISGGGTLCIENIDACCYTFSAAANRCRIAGAHLCTSDEIRSVMTGGIAVGNGGLLYDWMADQDADDSALYVNNGTDAANPDGARATSTSSYSRCCTRVE
ncbi:MAG TPA: hypothetical protein VIV40_22040 [Kofleriaceae bacterium]